MRKLIACLLLVVLVTATTSLAQTGSGKASKPASTTRSKAVYYISISRSNAAQFSKRQWGQAANTLRRGGVPAFFADYDTLPSAEQIRGEWLLVRNLRRLSAPAVDSLVLGPFSSRRDAAEAVQKLPRLLSDEGRPLNQDYPGEWSMGNYIIYGVRAK